MANGKVGKKELNFNIIVQDLRRKSMMEHYFEKRSMNNQLLWCKENNFEPEQF